MNVMIMAVYERIREIGTMAAIGTKPGKILFLFLIEGFFLGLTGTLVGIVFTCAVTYVINAVEISFNFGRQIGLVLSPRIEHEQIFLISGIVILVSILAALQPAYKASRMEPVNALRHV